MNELTLPCSSLCEGDQIKLVSLDYSEIEIEMVENKVITTVFLKRDGIKKLQEFLNENYSER